MELSSTPTTLPYLTACRALEFHWGSRPSYSPLSFASLSGSPVFDVEDSDGMVEVACCWRPHPFSPAPQAPYRGGQVALYGPDNALRWPLLWRRSNHFERDWLASQTRYARGSFPRRAMHV